MARMITLHAHPYSPNSRKVHWALEEMGTPYVYKTVNLAKREQKSAEFLRLNPNGRVPVMIDGEGDNGFVLYESNAILWYLADKYDRGNIVPEDLAERALIDQWMWWQASDLAPATGRPWSMKFYHTRFGTPFDEDKHRHMVQAAASPLLLLDQHLATRKYVVAERFTIADIALSEFFGLCNEAGIPLGDVPHLAAWFGRLAERPAFRKTRPT
jgi:glutathione S-transferase